MNDLTRPLLDALHTAEKLVLSPFGGPRPKPVEGQVSGRIALPAPDAGEDAATLREALRARRSTREFTADALAPQALSELLWAADGVNRTDGGRTAPSAVGMHAVDIYAATAQGLFLYEPDGHALRRVRDVDLRALTGLQPFVDSAPLDLVYVEDHAREHLVGEAAGEHYAYVEAGAMAQNVSLYCASHGLGCVVRALVDRSALGAAMELRPGQRILFAQTVGVPSAG